MGSLSRFNGSVKNGRNSGMPDPRNQQARVGGQYHPAYTNKASKEVSARWVGSIALNRKGFLDSQGQPVEGKTDYINITAWSGKNSDGKGLAEIFAKVMLVGREISFDSDIRTFRQDTRFNNGTPVINPDGSPHTSERIGFTIKTDTLIIGREPINFIINEIKAGRRGTNWEIAGTPDYEKFRTTMQQYMLATLQPNSPLFGYAAIVHDVTPQNPVYNTTNTNLAAGVVTPGEPTVNGFSLPQWKTTNPHMTNEMILANPDFAPFHDLIKSQMVVGAMSTPGLNIPNEPVIASESATKDAGGAFQQAF